MPFSSFLNRTLLALTFILALSANLPVQAADILEVDVSGQDGQDGQNGESYSYPAGEGRNGRDGGNASHPSPGQSAGAVDLSMKSGQPGFLSIRGRVIKADGSARSLQLDDIRISPTGYIRILAEGGDGGNGAYGGDGQDGGDGRKGRDAYVSYGREYPGENGGPGGNGGDAGEGSHGARGGSGGFLQVSLPEADMDLLALIATDVDGGQGGRAGINGHPGRGGDGGMGGLSHTYSKTVRKRNSDGEWVEEEVTVTIPGGMAGQDGFSGRRASKILHDGMDGTDGEINYIIQTENGDRHYSGVYHLKVKNFNIVSANQDGIIEPGERVYLTDFEIENVGQMPTPPTSKVEIFLSTNDYIIADPIILTLDRSLRPGESFVFENTDNDADPYIARDFESSKVVPTFEYTNNLNFVVREELFENPLPVRSEWTGVVTPGARFPRINRELDDFESAREFQITFPVEITDLTAAAAVGQGEATRFFFRVTNISGLTLGSEAEIKRQLSYLISGETGLDPSQVQFYAADGGPFDYESGLWKAIENLKPHESVYVEGIVALSEDATVRETVNVNSDLSLEKVQGGDVQEIQKATYPIRVTETYRKTAGSDFLLVINRNVDQAVIDAWKTLIEQTGSTVDLWDLSYESNFDLSRKLKSDSTLQEDFAGKTIIALTNEFDYVGTTVESLDLLNTRELLKAFADFGLNIYLAGPSKNAGNLLEAVLLPESFENQIHYSTIWELMRDFKSGVIPGQKEKENHFTYATSAELIGGYTIWGEPNTDLHRERQVRILTRLAKLEPTQTYYTFSEYNPELAGRFLFLKRWSTGSLMIARGLNPLGSNGVYHEMDLTPEEITDHENLLGLLVTVPFEQRIKMFERLAAKPSTEASLTEFDMDYLTALTTTIVFDLLREQILFHRSYVSSFSKMTYLNQFANMDISLDENSNEALTYATMQILAHLRFFSRASIKFWDAPWSRPAQVRRVLARFQSRFLGQKFQWSRDFNRGEAAKKIDLISDEIWSQYEDLKGDHGTFTEALRALIEEPLLHLTLGKWPRNFYAVTKDELAKAQKAADVRNKKIAAINKKAQEQRSDLIVPRPAGLSCQELLTAAP